MDGIHGLSGWRWLYIIEGALTIAVGIAVTFFIPDRYEDAKYLSERQMFLMHVRHAQTSAYSKDEGFSWVEVRKALTDPVIYLSGFIQLCFGVCLYGFVSATWRTKIPGLRLS
jgi:MFS family permease